MTLKYKNNAATTLSAGINSSVTSIPVVDGSVFPTLSGAEYFYATFEDISLNREVVKVTARSGNTLTVVRAQDGTTARSFVTGDKVEGRLVAAMLADLSAPSYILSALLTVDGVGSGLDADLFDGLSSASYAQIAAANVFTATQTINLNAYTAGPALPSGTVLHLIGADATQSRMFLDVFGSNAAFLGRRANGTNAAPTAVLSGDFIFTFGGFGYGTTGYLGVASALGLVTATEDFTDTAGGAKFSFRTTPNGTIVPIVRWHIENDGSLIAEGLSVTGTGTVNATGLFVNGVNISSTYAPLAAPSFTSTVTISSTSPELRLHETDATANETQWRVSSAAGDFYIQAISDDYSSATNAMIITRSGITTTAIQLVASALTFNGEGVWSAGNDGSGSGLDADLWDGNNFASYLNQAVLTSSSPTFANVYATTKFQSIGTYPTIEWYQTDGAADQKYWRVIADGAAWQLQTVNDVYSTAYTILNVTRVGMAGNTIQFYGNTMWHSGNDGSTSGLDADLWDGNQFATYLNQALLTTSNPTFAGLTTTNGTNTIVLSSDGNIEIIRAAGFAYIDFKNTSGEDYDLRLQESGGNLAVSGSITSSGIVISGSSGWHAGNDGAGSGLDADMLDGYSSAAFALLASGPTFTGTVTSTAATGFYANYQAAAQGGMIIFKKPATGTSISNDIVMDINANLFRMYENGGSYRGVYADFTGMASQSLLWHAGNDGAGSGLDADLWDGNNFASYLNQALLTSSSPTFASLTATTLFASGTTPMFQAVGSSTAGVNIIAPYPFMDYRDSDAALDTKNWRYDAQGANHSLILFNDAFSVASYVYTITRTAHTAATLNIGSITTFTKNGSTIWHAGNDGAGSTLDADLWDGNQFSTYLNQAVLTTSQPSFDSVIFTNADPYLRVNDNTKHLALSGGTGWTPTSSTIVLRSVGASTNTGGLEFYPGDTGTKGFVIGAFSSFQFNSNNIWHAGNDGSGSTLDADLLDGYNSSAFALLASNPTFTTANAIVSSVGSAGYGAFYAIGSGTNSSYLFMGNATNGERSRIAATDARSMLFSNNGGVTSHFGISSAGVLTASGSTVWHAGNDGAGSGLDADLLDGLNSTLFVYGMNQSGSHSANPTQTFTEIAQYKSGFWDISAAAWTPDTGWWWGLTMAHTSNGPAYNFGGQFIIQNSGGTPAAYLRSVSGGGTPAASAWQKIWTAAVDGSGSGLDADTVDGYHVGTSGATIPLLNGGNVFSGINRFDSQFSQSIGGTIKGYIGIGTQIDGGSGTDMTIRGEDGISFSVAGSRYMRLTSGALSVTPAITSGGAITAGTVVYAVNGFSATSASSYEPQINLYNTNNDGTPPYIIFNKSPADTTVTAGDNIGTLLWYGRGSSSTQGTAASIWAQAEGTRGTNWVAVSLVTQVMQTSGSYRDFTLGATAGITWGGQTIWHAGNDGSTSGLDADLLDGVHGSQFVRADTATTLTTGVTTTVTNNTSSNIAAIPSAVSGVFETKGNGTGPAVITFHRPSSWAVHLGLDTDNVLKVGGWSMGAYAHVLWHSGNDGSTSGLDADLLDGVQLAEIPSGNNGLGVNTTTASMNSFSKAGWYSYLNATGAPTTDWWSWMNVPGHTGVGDVYGYQLACSYWGDDIRFRRCMTNSWQSWTQIWAASNDGAGSGLDADLWDGNQFASYLNQAVLTSSSPSFVDVTITSDERLKTDIEPIQGALAKVLKLRGAEYTRRATGKREIGVIAQDLEAAGLELLVDRTESNLRTVKYMRLSAVLIEAVKELSAEIDKLKAAA